jgi:hypothetical protein
MSQNSKIEWTEHTCGESGYGFRPCDPNWVRDLRDRCLREGKRCHSFTSNGEDVLQKLVGVYFMDGLGSSISKSLETKLILTAICNRIG